MGEKVQLDFVNALARMRGSYLRTTMIRSLVASLLLFTASPFANVICAADSVGRLHFELPSTTGELVSLSPGSDTRLTVVCFLGCECPLAKLYGPRLQRLADQFRDRGVEFIGIDSNIQDSISEVRAFVNQHQIRFPMLIDRQGKVAEAFGASRTSEVFVVDQFHAIRYQGRIDDQYQPGLTRNEPNRHDLVLALEELLAGKPVAVATTTSVGCIIGRAKSTEISTELTYAQEISRILQKHCVECHREGEIGPFALTDYDEVVGWGEMMLEVIDNQRMPPWHANPAHGKFKNARRMPDEDIAVLREWVQGGMPFGEESHLPPPIETVAGWQLPREPDLVLDMHSRPFTVPADGTVEYQYFVVDPKFEEDKWVVGTQIVPGNRSVVHHCLVFIRPPDGADFRRVWWLTGYVPGQIPLEFPQGHALRVPAGSRLVFQLHYTPTGTEQTDLTRLGLLFAEDHEVTHEVFSAIGINREFEIPPNAADFPVHGDVDWFPKNGKLIGIAPHMHVRGKAFSVNIEQEGTKETLLDVPHYDFNWQHFYQFEEPIALANINDISFTSVFDNSAKNPVNPDPSEHVTWGDQTWEEMAMAFFAIAQPRDSQTESSRGRSETHPPASAEDVEEFVSSFFKRFDKNADGIISRRELPIAIETFGFQRLDRNDSGVLERDEIGDLARTQLAAH